MMLLRAGARTLLAAILPALVPAPNAHAALTCEQVFAIAQASVRFRDQGHSLNQVLAALKDVDPDKRLNPAEQELLRKAVSIAYLGQASPEEIALECVQGRANSGIFPGRPGTKATD